MPLPLPQFLDLVRPLFNEMLSALSPLIVSPALLPVDLTPYLLKEGRDYCVVT